jgi:glycosyltransferase involved in cell wall biosynthesis
MEEPRRPEYVPMLKQLVETLGLTTTVRFLGYIPKAHQLELIRQSIAVIQPTLFEGGPGGGAVYDAVSLGVRAIVSDIPVNREVRAEPGQITYFPPRDARSLAAEILRVAATRWVMPSPENLYQQSLASASRLSERLYGAIRHVTLAAEQGHAD